MLIRIIIDNYLSFGEQIEFNMLPGRQTRFNHHKYKLDDIEVLKMSAIYGANGAGKSNFVKAIRDLKKIVTNGQLPTWLSKSKFKLSQKNKERGILLGVEFINEGTPFLYAIEVDKSFIVKEELYISGLGQKDNSIVFERTRNNDGENEINFSIDFNTSDEGKLLKKIISDSYKKSNKPFINILNELEHALLRDVGKAFEWFKKKLQIVEPNSKPSALVHRFNVEKKFKDFTKDMLCSFHTGIHNVETESKNLKEFLGENEEEDFKKIEELLGENPDQIVGLRQKKEEIIVTRENGEILAHRMFFNHSGEEEKAKFYINEESDGTQRLIDYIPTFKKIIENDSVYIVDEIERSIHPLIIKELVQKFASQLNTKGQLIFTTHESNLLDQDIFRQDEIWFTEKDKFGKSHMYPLSEFKEHHTLDIQKGYLDGRYGAIPFIGNLKELNWTDSDANK